MVGRYGSCLRLRSGLRGRGQLGRGGCLAAADLLHEGDGACDAGQGHDGAQAVREGVALVAVGLVVADELGLGDVVLFHVSPSG